MAFKAELDRIQRTNPQQYGVLRHNISAIQRAIDRCERNYPEARQLYDLLDDPGTNSRSFGNALTILSGLGVIQLHTNRNNRNRYDLTQYRAEVLEELRGIVN